MRYNLRKKPRYGFDICECCNSLTLFENIYYLFGSMYCLNCYKKMRFSESKVGK